jgi:hypothetical protein
VTVDVTTPVPIAIFITLIGAALTGGVAGSRLTAWFTRRLERQRQQRERLSVLRLLDQQRLRKCSWEVLRSVCCDAVHLATNSGNAIVGMLVLSPTWRAP